MRESRAAKTPARVALDPRMRGDDAGEIDAFHRSRRPAGGGGVTPPAYEAAANYNRCTRMWGSPSEVCETETPRTSMVVLTRWRLCTIESNLLTFTGWSNFTVTW